jgi:TIR domain
MKPRVVFISHVEEDRDIAESIAAELEPAGCSVWYYERDGLPGVSYLAQTRQAIDSSRCVLIVVSPSAVNRPHQVDKELVRAHETGKHIIPILRDISFRDFRKVRPDWHQAIGAVVGVELTAGTIGQSLQRLTMGLRAIGIVAPEATLDSPNTARESFGDAPVEDNDAGDFEASHEEEDVPSLPSDLRSEHGGDAEPDDFIAATFVHEHPSTGFLADVIVNDGEGDYPTTLCVGFSHRLLGNHPRIVVFNVGPRPDPVQYFRFPDLVHGYPVLLRVYWLGRMPGWATFTRSFGVTSCPVVQTIALNDALVNADAAGIMTKDGFSTIIAAGERLPRTHRRRFRTSHDSQKAISITPAVRRSNGEVRAFQKFKLSMPVAPARVAWLEFAFRVDPDGRYTVMARDPLLSMRMRDLIVVQ